MSESPTLPRDFEILDPPFITKKNSFYTSALFYEQWVIYPAEDRVIDPQFTLYAPKPGLIDGKGTFISEGDPTGYKWAIKYLASWDHWERLMKAPWFVAAYEVWVKELKAKLKSEAINKIQEIASSGSPQALPAAKYIARAEWDLELNSRGRPSKEVLKGKLAEAAKVLEDEKEDMRRIGLGPEGRIAALPLTVIQGDKK